MVFSDSLKRIVFGLTLSAVLLTPLFFLPITSEFYEYNKQALLFSIAGLSIILLVFSYVSDRQLRLTRTPLGLPLLTLAAAWVFSAALQSPNKFEAFFDPNQTILIVSLVTIFFTSINVFHSKKQLDSLLNIFHISTILLGVVTLLWSSGLAPALLPKGVFSSPIWTPTGNAFGTLTVLGLHSLFTLILWFKSIRQKSKSVLRLASLIIAPLAVCFLIYRLFFISDNPNRPVFLSQSASWAIALESLKSSPLFGTGPATFLSDFTRFRPINYNLTPNWAIRFATSSNYYLQLLSTLGILGFSAYTLVAWRSARLFIRSLKTSAESSLHPLTVASATTLLAGLLAQLVIPTSLVFLSTLFFLMIILIASLRQIGSSLVQDANIDIVAADFAGSRQPILPWLSLIIVLAIVLPAGFFAIRGYVAEVLFRNAINHASKNDGRATYDTLIATIRVNPYKDTYRSTYAQTNLLLANAVISGKTELTAEERTTVNRLIQQSIREAKNAVALNPQKVTNWENLAGIYRSLLTLAKGADAWAIASYRSAIQLDPVNPNLRISLGGIYYGAKNYDEAIRLFTDAVNLKPNHANAHYNLAAAYREKGDINKAISSMQTVINLVNRDSADYTKAVKELEELQANLDTSPNLPTEPPTTELESPTPLPTPAISPIELPADLGPETTPSPTPQPSPSPTTNP